MSPIVPAALILAAAAGLGYAVLHKGSTSLPPDLQATFQQVLTQSTDVDAIEALAVKLDSLGFHQEAAQLRAREASLRGGASPPPHPLDPLQPIQPAPQPAPTPAQPAQPLSPSSFLPAQFMKVTTSDPAPSGDLALRSAPAQSAPVVGAAEKDSTVTVKAVSPDGVFIQVEALNPAGRRPSATGWAHSAFLVPTSPMQASGARAAMVGAARVLCAGAKPPPAQTMVCACPTGCGVRPLPTYAVGVVGLVPAFAVVTVVRCVPGRKHDPRSPGQSGGFCLVDSQGLRGWVPTEYLVPADGRVAA